MTRRALITGANGFVGRYLGRHLESIGWEVVRLAHSADVDSPLAVPCDITDAHQVGAALAESGDITHVFHLAAISFVPQAVSRPFEVNRVNVVGTANLVRAILKLQCRPRLIFASSSAAYGPPASMPLREDHPLNAADPYGRSKAFGERLCVDAAAQGLDAVRARPFNHSGAGQSDQFALSSFARQLARIALGKARPVIETGDLDAKRDFTHVEDVVRAYALLAEHGQRGEAYNICSGSAARIGDALDKLIALASIRAEVHTDPARARPSDTPELYGDPAKLEALGWRREHTLDDILHDLLDYWMNAEQ
ncbi:MAG: GDP-mannose 4,6-dehydratase [Candidatus Hydrogenedentota bacterium]